MVGMAKTFEFVLRYIEDEIKAGRLQAGDHLMPERELATHLNVSRTAVREAIRVYQAQGLLTSNVGRGPKSGTRLTPAPATALASMVRIHVALGGFAVAEVMETRIALETASVRLAAQHCTDADIQELRELATLMASPDIELPDFNAADTRFHVTLAMISHNQLVADLTQAVRDALATPIYHASTALPDWHAFRARLIEDHLAIVAAIEHRDTDAAAAVVERHIRDAHQHLFSEQ